MTDFKLTTGEIGGQPIDETSATRHHDLGRVIRAKDFSSDDWGEGEFIYLLGVISTVVGSVVVYSSDDYSTILTIASSVGPIAVAMSINVGSQYGWYQIQGKGAAKAKTGFIDNADCYVTSTAGSIDDADVGGDYINGMRGAAAVGTPSSGLAEVELWRPFVRQGKDD